MLYTKAKTNPPSTRVSFPSRSPSASLPVPPAHGLHQFVPRRPSQQVPLPGEPLDHKLASPTKPATVPAEPPSPAHQQNQPQPQPQQPPRERSAPPSRTQDSLITALASTSYSEDLKGSVRALTELCKLQVGSAARLPPGSRIKHLGRLLQLSLSLSSLSLQRTTPGLPAKTGTGYPLMPSPVPYHQIASCRSTHQSEPLAGVSQEVREECLVRTSSFLTLTPQHPTLMH